MAWNIPRSSSRSSVPLKLEEEAKWLTGRGEFLCLYSHVCRNVRLGSLLEHCSIVCCLFGHVLLIVIDLIFCRTIASLPLCCRIIASLPRCCKNHREPSTVLQNYRETSTVLQEPSRAFQNQHNNASLPADYCKLKQYLCMLSRLLHVYAHVYVVPAIRSVVHSLASDL